jgi:hypothetical protein
MTPQEILDNIKKHFDKSSDSDPRRRRSSEGSPWMEIVNECPKYLLFKDYEKYGLSGCPDLGKCRVVCCGDGEYTDGEGSREAEIVLYFEDHDVFIKKDGYYTSYDGYNFDGTTKIVKPKQKVITYYE